MLIILILTILKIDKRIIGFFLGLFLLPVWGLGQPAPRQKLPDCVSEQNLSAPTKNDPNLSYTNSFMDNNIRETLHFYGAPFSETGRICYFSR